MKIAIEGGDYSGKTTVSKILHEKYDYPLYRQPGVPVLRDLIKNDLLQEDPNEKTVALAFALDRAIQEEKYNEDGVFITDRSVISSLVIQSSQLAMEYLTAINSDISFPEITIWLRIGKNELKKRMSDTKGEDIYDEKALIINERYDRIMPELKRKVKPLQVIEIFCDKKTPEEIADEIDEEIIEILRDKDLVELMEKFPSKVRQIFGIDKCRWMDKFFKEE